MYLQHRQVFQNEIQTFHDTAVLGVHHWTVLVPRLWGGIFFPNKACLAPRGEFGVIQHQKELWSGSDSCQNGCAAAVSLCSPSVTGQPCACLEYTACLKGAKQLKMLVFALHFWLVAFCTWSDFNVLLFHAFQLFVVLPMYTYSHAHTWMHTHWTKSIDSMQVEMKHQGTHRGEI